MQIETNPEGFFFSKWRNPINLYKAWFERCLKQTILFFWVWANESLDKNEDRSREKIKQEYKAVLVFKSVHENRFVSLFVPLSPNSEEVSDIYLCLSLLGN